jgi:hypothetical protein
MPLPADDATALPKLFHHPWESWPCALELVSPERLIAGSAAIVALGRRVVVVWPKFDNVAEPARFAPGAEVLQERPRVGGLFVQYLPIGASFGASFVAATRRRAAFTYRSSSKSV